jgi:hypothetical protein
MGVATGEQLAKVRVTRGRDALGHFEVIIHIETSLGQMEIIDFDAFFL